MRLRLFAFFALVCFAGALRADTITGTVSGVIPIQGPGPYIDKNGLFGPVGGILTGDTVTIQYSYNTADFQTAPAICVYTNCQQYTFTSLSPAESISVTVNGQTQTYTPSFYSELEFQNEPAIYQDYFSEIIDAGVGGASIKLYSPYSVTFGQPVAGGSNPLNTVYTSANTVYLYGTRGVQGFVFAASTPSPAPEPSSIILVGTGLLGMAGVLKRRMNKSSRAMD